MRFYILSLYIILTNLSCSIEGTEQTITAQRDASQEKEQEEERLRYLALGDSYTIGESVDPTLRFPVQIANSLEERGYLTEAPEIIAVTGWTTSNLLAGIKAANPQGPYDLVSLLIGVNNQYQGMDINIYRTEFEELINQSVCFAGNNPSRVIVLSIPDWGVTPFASGRDREKIAGEIDLYNAINKEISLSKGIVWVDVTAISRLAEKDATLIAVDGLHPSGRMYKEWARLAVAEIVKVLEKE